MTQPNFFYERRLWHVKSASKPTRKGFRFVVGVDEVGRGAWAGPLVVAAVIFPPSGCPYKQRSRSIGTSGIEGVNDSKLLKPRFREELAREIKKKALAWDVTEVGVGVINRIGIGKATEKGMRKAIRDIIEKLRNEEIKEKRSDIFILVDYFYIPYLAGLGRKNQLGIKDGDQKSFSIAAASILAKVHRDQIMRSLSRKYPQYGWGRNKGYGTKLHQKAILRYGLTRFHRKQFVKTWQEKRNSSPHTRCVIGKHLRKSQAYSP